MSGAPDGAGRRPLFVSHAGDDAEGQLFLTHVFNRADSVWRPLFYSVEGPRPPHATSLLRHLGVAEALVVLLSAEMASRPWTRSWIGFEVGVAAHRGLPVLVVEPASGFVDYPVPGVTHYARRQAKATGIESSFWAKVARADFKPVEDEPWDASGEGLWTRGAAWFYNLGLKTRSVEGAFTQFRCPEDTCRASYFVEESMLASSLKCPSCRREVATPLVQLARDLEVARKDQRAASPSPR